jgi:hypothetical protein
VLLDYGNIEANPKVRMEPNPPHRTDKPLPQLNGRYLFALGRNSDSLSYGISADWMILNLDGNKIKDMGGTAPGFADGVEKAALVKDIKAAAENHSTCRRASGPTGLTLFQQMRATRREHRGGLKVAKNPANRRDSSLVHRPRPSELTKGALTAKGVI